MSQSLARKGRCVLLHSAKKVSCQVSISIDSDHSLSLLFTILSRGSLLFVALYFRLVVGVVMLVALS